jgi:hypothetical protein
MYTLTGFGQPRSGGDCSGWEKDPESFSKRVAEHYVRTVLGLPLKAKRIFPYYSTGKEVMEVEFSDTLGVAVSFKWIPSYVLALRLRHQPVGPPRWYTYACTPQGDLVLTRRPRPSPAPAPSTNGAARSSAQVPTAR